MGFCKKLRSSLKQETHPEFDNLIKYSLNYYNDFVLPYKKYLKVSENQKIIFEDIIQILEKEVRKDHSAEDIQTMLYEVGKKHKFENLKDFFKLVYQVLLGQEQGPRLGSFIKLYGVKETIDSIKKVLVK